MQSSSTSGMSGSLKIVLRSSIWSNIFGEVSYRLSVLFLFIRFRFSIPNAFQLLFFFRLDFILAAMRSAFSFPFCFCNWNNIDFIWITQRKTHDSFPIISEIFSVLSCIRIGMALMVWLVHLFRKRFCGWMRFNELITTKCLANRIEMHFIL